MFLAHIIETRTHFTFFAKKLFIEIPLHVRHLCTKQQWPIITSGQSNLTKRPHRRRIWTVQTYLPGGTNVHLYLMHASLDPLESIFQTASPSVELFLHSTRHRVPMLYNGPPLFPLKIAHLHARSGPLSNTCFLGLTRVQYPNGILISSENFCRAHDNDRQTDIRCNY